jgi:hypothetical protein
LKILITLNSSFLTITVIILGVVFCIIHWCFDLEFLFYKNLPVYPDLLSQALLHCGLYVFGRDNYRQLLHTCPPVPVGRQQALHILSLEKDHYVNAMVKIRPGKVTTAIITFN